MTESDVAIGDSVPGAEWVQVQFLRRQGDDSGQSRQQAIIVVETITHDSLPARSRKGGTQVRMYGTYTA